jgi:Fe-S-cluster-containing dehydrogenase component
MTHPAPRTGTAQPTLVIDLDTCVGCHACSIACKAGSEAVPLADDVWPNQVFSFEAAGDPGRTLHVPRMCQHCATPDCVTVCPTGASYRRASDGVALINEARCIGCRLCSWACPYGAREYNAEAGVVRKCTLCMDRPDGNGQPACVTSCPTGARHFGDIADPTSAVADLVRRRGGFALVPEAGTEPAVRYLPPRPQASPAPTELDRRATSVTHWTDRAVAR